VLNEKKLKLSKGPILYQKAKQIIPGGTQLFSKRPELFAPTLWPAYYSKAKGCRVWDLDGRQYIDMSMMGVGACILGYGDPDVDQAVREAIKKGVTSTLNCPEEVELARLMIQLHPWAQMVRYARSGGEAMAIAVRIARAHTKKEKVLFSGYHGWCDWYLAANLGESHALDERLMPGLKPLGVPRALRGTTFPFSITDIPRLKKILSQNKGQVAAMIMEPARGEEPSVEVLKQIRNIATKNKIVLIFDEITSGFRMNAGGIHLRYGIFPDIAVFAKSMANGYAMAAIIGVEKVMQAAQASFISSTNWTERIGPVAALATIKKYQRYNVAKHIIQIGNEVKKIWRNAAAKTALPIQISGLPTLPNFKFISKHDQVFSTFFTIEMLKRGFLGFRQFKPSYAHTKKEVQHYKTAVEEIFFEISKRDPSSLLKTPIAHRSFERLTKE